MQKMAEASGWQTQLNFKPTTNTNLPAMGVNSSWKCTLHPVKPLSHVEQTVPTKPHPKNQNGHCSQPLSLEMAFYIVVSSWNRVSAHGPKDLLTNLKHSSPHLDKAKHCVQWFISHSSGPKILWAVTLSWFIPMASNKPGVYMTKRFLFPEGVWLDRNCFSHKGVGM